MFEGCPIYLHCNGLWIEIAVHIVYIFTVHVTVCKEVCTVRQLQSMSKKKIFIKFVPWGSTLTFSLPDIWHYFKVIPQKLKLPMNFFETFPDSSLLSTVSKKNNKNDTCRTPLRYDGPIRPHLCLYPCESRALFIGWRYILR